MWRDMHEILTDGHIQKVKKDNESGGFTDTNRYQVLDTYKGVQRDRVMWPGGQRHVDRRTRPRKEKDEHTRQKECRGKGQNLSDTRTERQWKSRQKVDRRELYGGSAERRGRCAVQGGPGAV